MDKMLDPCWNAPDKSLLLLEPQLTGAATSVTAVTCTWKVITSLHLSNLAPAQWLGAKVLQL